MQKQIRVIRSQVRPDSRSCTAEPNLPTAFLSLRSKKLTLSIASLSSCAEKLKPTVSQNLCPTEPILTTASPSLCPTKQATLPSSCITPNATSFALNSFKSSFVSGVRSGEVASMIRECARSRVWSVIGILVLVTCAGGSEFPERECCDPVYPPNTATTAAAPVTPPLSHQTKLTGKTGHPLDAFKTQQKTEKLNLSSTIMLFRYSFKQCSTGGPLCLL